MASSLHSYFTRILFSLATLIYAQSTYAVLVDDFEGYADTPSLQAAWPISVGLPTVSLETIQVFSGSQSMRMVGSYSPIPVMGVKRTFAAAQDWAGGTVVKVRHKGVAGNSTVDITMQLINSSGQLIVDAKTTGGTASRTITPLNWNLPASFTCSAVDDAIIEGIHTSSFSFGISSTDPVYDNISTSNRTATITDNGFLIAPDIETLTYDGTNVYFIIQTHVNQKYLIEETGTLTSTNWTTRLGPIPGAGSPFNIPIAVDTNQNMIRVTTTPNP